MLLDDNLIRWCSSIGNGSPKHSRPSSREGKERDTSVGRQRRASITGQFKRVNLGKAKDEEAAMVLQTADALFGWVQTGAS